MMEISCIVDQVEIGESIEIAFTVLFINEILRINFSLEMTG